MKLVVLGNGFDLGSGLPTSYKDYFEYYESNHSEVFKKIEGFLDLEVKTKIEFSSRSIRSPEDSLLRKEYNQRKEEIFKNISD